MRGFSGAPRSLSVREIRSSTAESDLRAAGFGRSGFLSPPSRPESVLSRTLSTSLAVAEAVAFGAAGRAAGDVGAARRDRLGVAAAVGVAAARALGLRQRGVDALREVHLPAAARRRSAAMRGCATPGAP